MGSRRRYLAGGFAVASLVSTSFVPSSVEAAPVGEVLVEGLSSPKGLALTPDRAALVGQGAFAFGPEGEGPVVRYSFRGPIEGRRTDVTEPFALTDIAISPLDGTGWALSGPMLFHQLADGTIVEVLDIAAYQATDPDPVDQDDFAEESNPYGLTVTPQGDALVADAAGNDLIRVTPEGDASTVAMFDLESILTDHLGPDSGLPPAIMAEAVPTTVVVGTDGAYYVGELKGFPFRPGSSHVWRIVPGDEPVNCSVNEPDAGCTVYRSGLTAIQDIAITRNMQKLFVYELAADGVLAFEAGFETGEFPPAVLLQIDRKGPVNMKVTERARGELSQPGGVSVANDGKVYVTDGMFGNGRLLRIWP
jgi:NHL repeat-containing protein